MKKLILIVLMVFCCGCWKYSEGTTVGYVTTVEGGIFWNTVFIRAELESSNTDGYAIAKENKNLQEQLLNTAKNKQRVEVHYIKHFSMARICNEGTNCPSDEIVYFKILD